MKSYKDDPVFCKIIGLVLNSEGGFVDDKDDPGGPTNHGIAWNYNAAWLSKNGITRNTMKSLTVDQAKQCYYERFWLASESDGISDEGLAYIHFDAAVNCGPGQAAKFLERLSVNPKYFDGTGDNNEELFMQLVHEYEAQRIKFYRQDVSAKLRKKYLQGWLNRMAYVSKHAEKLV